MCSCPSMCRRTRLNSLCIRFRIRLCSLSRSLPNRSYSSLPRRSFRTLSCSSYSIQSNRCRCSPGRFSSTCRRIPLRRYFGIRNSFRCSFPRTMSNIRRGSHPSTGRHSNSRMSLRTDVCMSFRILPCSCLHTGSRTDFRMCLSIPCRSPCSSFRSHPSSHLCRLFCIRHRILSYRSLSIPYSCFRIRPYRCRSILPNSPSIPRVRWHRRNSFPYTVPYMRCGMRSVLRLCFPAPVH